MAYREFRDSGGTDWMVWDTVPSRPEGLDPQIRDGWLTFECAEGRRRLAPPPKNWETVAESRLELMCRAAEAISRTTPARGSRVSEAAADNADSV